MLSSNQPYGRVDDGIGAGFVGGAVVGGAAAGAAHMWGKQGLNKIKGLNDNMALARVVDIPAAENAKVDKIASQHEKAGKAIAGAEKWRGKAFGGGWKGKAAAYGGSVLAAGLLGAGADYLND